MTYDAIVEISRNADVFSNRSFDALDPNLGYRFLPNHLGPHSNYRAVVNNRLSLRRTKANEPHMRTAARRLASSLAARGACEFVNDFSMAYTGELFFSAIIGFREGEADEEFLLKQVKAWFNGLGSQDKSISPKAAQAVGAYYVNVLADRRRKLRDPQTDLISFLIQSKVDDVPLDDASILNFATRARALPHRAAAALELKIEEKRVSRPTSGAASALRAHAQGCAATDPWTIHEASMWEVDHAPLQV